MSSSGGLLGSAFLMALVGSTLLARAQSPGKASPAAAPNVRVQERRARPEQAPQKPKPAASVEPTEAQLLPVDPVWRRGGWRAVVPHAYVLRRLVAARVRPETTAPADFWLNGGTRVPVLEQRPRWWRVGWSQGRTGWMPAEDLEPHASFVLIDAQTGRVLQRLAAKGQDGAVAQGSLLWSLANTGVTRLSPGESPAFWSSSKVLGSGRSSLGGESEWTPDRTAFFVRERGDTDEQGRSADSGELLEVDTRTGAVRPLGDPGGRSVPVSADAAGRVLLRGDKYLQLYDTRHRREIRRVSVDVENMAPEVAKSGAVYAPRADGKGNGELLRYDRDLKPGVRLKLAGDLVSLCLSADERTLGLVTLPHAGDSTATSHIRLLNAETFAPLETLTLRVPLDQPDIRALLGSKGSRLALVTEMESEGDTLLIRFDARGRQIRSWKAPETFAVSPDGRSIYLARDSDILVVNLDGTSRKIPFTWRRPLPQRYLPEAEDPDSPTHLEISDLTLTADGRTLILTEWLNGDAAG